VCVSPVPPTAGSPAPITYTPAGAPICERESVYIHLGWNSLDHRTLAGCGDDDGLEYVGVSTLSRHGNALIVYSIMATTFWDNNNSQDWKFAVLQTASRHHRRRPDKRHRFRYEFDRITVSWSSTSNSSRYVVYRAGSPIGTRP